MNERVAPVGSSPASGVASALSAVIQLLEAEPTSVSALAFGALRRLTQGDIFRGLSPDDAWDFLARGLMSSQPDMFFRVLREFEVLPLFLPEVAAWYGVPQLSDGGQPIDVGVHQERVLAETARQGASLAVRFAALMHKIGKGGTPREIWPSHYKHEVRGHAALDAIEQRLRVPPEVSELAHLTIDEGDRVHRASLRRAGAITQMVARVHALEQPERFEQLLTVCTCDYAAYAGHSAAEYPKAPLLRLAARACASVDIAALDEEDVLEERTRAVVEVLCSLDYPGAEPPEA